MPDATPDPSHRSARDVPAESIELREADELEGEEGIFEVRMPIATTGEVRNQGDEPLTRDELQGMARQINERALPVFIDHGNSGIGGAGGLSGGTYSAAGKIGEWTDADMRTREASAVEGDQSEQTELVATARLMDPEEMPMHAGKLKEVLTAIKEQVKRDFSLSSSIGWRDDGSMPGGVDLMEASIVGIGADPRTTTAGADAPTIARAVAESTEGFNAGAFLRALGKEGVQMRPFGPPGGDPNRWDTFEECENEVDDWEGIDDPEAFCGAAKAATEGRSRAEYEVGEETIDITPPEGMRTAAEMALDADERLDTDCGTGTGTERANQILADEVGPEVVDEVAAYLTSHEEDVTAEGPLSDWSDEEWADCGNLQYAKWGGDGSGDQMRWAQTKANAVAEAKGEEIPYEDLRDDADTETHMTDDDTPDDGGTTDSEQGADGAEPSDEQADDGVSAEDVLEWLQDNLQGTHPDMDDDEDDEDEDDEEEQSADDADEERSLEDLPEDRREVLARIDSELDQYEDDLADLRSGEKSLGDVVAVGGGDDESADGTDTDRDADTEQDDTTDDGPNWR